MSTPFDSSVTDKLLTTTRAVRKRSAYYTGDDFKPGARRDARSVTYLDRWKAPI